MKHDNYLDNYRMPHMKFLNVRLQKIFLGRRKIEIAIQLPPEIPIRRRIGYLEGATRNQQWPQKQKA